MRTKISELLLFLAFFISSIAVSQTVDLPQRYSGNHTALEKLAEKLNEQWRKDSLQAIEMGFPFLIDAGEKTYTLKSISNNLPIYVGITTQGEIQSYFGDDLWSAPYNVTGAGLPAGMWEAFESGGGALPNPSNGNLQTNGLAPSRVFIGNVGSISSHATNVALRLGGDGSTDPLSGLGIAKATNIYTWDVSNIESELAQFATSLLVSNHSYAQIRGRTSPISITLNSVTQSVNWWSESNVGKIEDFGFGRYSFDDGVLDLIAYYAPYHCIVKSAGNDRGASGATPVTTFKTVDNGATYTFDTYSTPVPEVDGGSDGFDCIPQGTTAKNAFIIGACADIAGGYTGPSDVNVMSFSSFGPTDDGRLKPDFVAPGAGGTSFSAPNVSGSIVLLQEIALNNLGYVLFSSTIKALLAQTAFEAGNAGPDYKHGWGLINPKGAADMIINADGTNKIVEEYLPNGQTKKYYAYVSTPADVATTLAWTDPDGTPATRTYGPSDLNNTMPMLVNNLNITIKEISTNLVTSPFVLNPANPNNVATTGTNSVDNCEKIKKASAPAGWYEIEVSHSGTLKDENGNTSGQTFSLVMSGFDVYSCLQEGAVTFSTIWSSGIWSAGVPTIASDVLITENLALTSNLSVDNIVIKAGATINLGTFDLTINGSLISEGNVEVTGTGSAVFAGSAAQGICGDVVFNHAELNNTNGLTIGNSEGLTSIKDVLSLTAGTVTSNSRIRLYSTSDIGKNAYAQIHNGAGSVSGNIYVENTVQGSSGWRNIASPVNTTIIDLLEEQDQYNIANGGGSVYRWNAASSQWVAPSSENDLFDATSPYTVFFGTSVVGSNSYVFNSMPLTCRLFGVPNNGAVNNTLAYHNGSGGSFVSIDKDGWNMIANPYPENLDWDVINNHADFGTTNINGSYYIWDANQNKYLTHNGTIGDAELGGKIAPMQGYYVKLNNTGAASSTAFDFDNTMRTTVKAQFLKTAPEQVILAITNLANQEKDRTYIAFEQAATRDFDSQFDAYQLKFNPITSALIYSGEFQGADSTILAINTLPVAETNYVIPVFVEAPNAGLFSVKLDTATIDTNWEVYLINVQDSTQYDLRQANAAINYLPNDNPHRFWLLINPSAVGISQFEAQINTPKVWLNESGIEIRYNLPASEVEIKVMNAAGQLLYQSCNQQGTAFSIPAGDWNDIQGVIVVELISREGRFVQRLTNIR